MIPTGGWSVKYESVSMPQLLLIMCEIQIYFLKAVGARMVGSLAGRERVRILLNVQKMIQDFK